MRLAVAFDAGLFKLKENRYRQSDTLRPKGAGARKMIRRRGMPMPCRRASSWPAAPAISTTFAWHWFVHGGPSACRATLRFFESGASLQTENLWVQVRRLRRIEEHGAGLWPGWSRQSARVSRTASSHRSIRRWLREDPRAILLGATNGWFPVTLSVLAIPQTGSPLAQLVADGWTFFEDVSSAPKCQFVVRTLKKTAQLPGIEQFTDEQIWAAIETHRDGGANVEQSDLKGPEWKVLTAATRPPTIRTS